MSFKYLVNKKQIFNNGDSNYTCLLSAYCVSHAVLTALYALIGALLFDRCCEGRV